MAPLHPIELAALRSRWLPGLIIAFSLLVLASVVGLAMFQARQRIREQIASRDADVLHAVALLHYEADLREGLAGPTPALGDPLGIALKSAELRGVLGVRVFDPAGNFVESFPTEVMEADLPPGDLPTLTNLRPLSRFDPHAQLAAQFYPDKTVPTNTIPLLEVCVPLSSRNGPLAGIVQFLVEGQSIAAEYQRLDRLLLMQAAVAVAAGGSILTLALAWAFQRLRRAHRLLAERSQNLARANQELALAAKTSALGAVAAHLIHGLKNPLAGLQNFVTTRGAAAESGAPADWEQAVVSTRRMQTMIHQVIGVLREESTGCTYELTLAELEQMVRTRVQPLARERGVGFTTLVATTATLPNRVANLAALILVNLAENAIEATPRGRCVSFTVRRTQAGLAFEMRDEGPGFPADVPLFMPCRSVKEGGTGIGLALCKQLANHLGAELELIASTAAGCAFSLHLALPPSGPGDRQSPIPRAQVEGGVDAA